MSKTDKPKELFTASEVARFCQVDLKTIHNWADRNEVRHFRTPGRHLRFRREDVLDFLRKYGYPIPDVLVIGRPKVAVLDDDEATRAGIAAELSDAFDVATYDDPIRALLAIGANCPDVTVMDAEVAGIDALRIVAALRNQEATRHVRAVLYADTESSKQPALDAGASAHVLKADVPRLLETLEALMGVSR